MRIVLNSVVEKDRRVELLNIINDRRIKYFEKLDLIKDRLTYIMEDYVEFMEFDIDSIDEILKCFGLSKSHARKNML